MLARAIVLAVVLLALPDGWHPLGPMSSLAQIKPLSSRVKAEDAKALSSSPEGAAPKGSQILSATSQDMRSETGLVAVIKKVMPSVVRIETDARKLGSGVIVDDRGLVLTNNHVGVGAGSITVTLNSGTQVKVIGQVAVARERDLLLLKTKPFEKHLAIKIARELPQAGESVAALGNPQGLTFSTSAGIVSAIRTGLEVSGMLGKGTYEQLGYSPNAKWIQHTAAISQGSSGGPLVNMRGELLGLNTWGFTTGQNLNFAIGGPDIIRLLGSIDEKSPPDIANQAKPADGADESPAERKPAVRSKLSYGIANKPKAEKAPGDVAENQSEPKIVSDAFPSGRSYSPVIFEIPKFGKWVGNPIVMTYQNGSLFAIASHVAGELDGVTVAQHENRQPMVYANYLDGKRHGLLETWNEKGEPVLFTQYTKGKRDGFSCFFEDGKLCMIIEYRHGGNVRCIRLISGVEVENELFSKAEANKDSMGRVRLASLKKVEDNLDANERKFKDQVLRAVSPAKKIARREHDANVASALARASSAQQAEMQNLLNNSNRAWQSTYTLPVIVK